MPLTATYEDIKTYQHQFKKNKITQVIAHVHWVYCVHILLNSGPFDTHVREIAEKQDRIKKILSSKEKSRVIYILTQIDGSQRYKNELQQAIADT